jgi:methionyl-tRNA formyltransferase
VSIIFFGSSEFSLGALKASLQSGHPVSLVITTPDANKGRGLQSQPTPVRIFAEENGFPFEAPENLKDSELLKKIENLKPEFYVVSSYGKLIPTSWLQVPSKLCINIHPSLLPKYRGAAPINWPIINGDKETGLSIAEVTSKLDAGDIFSQRKIPLELTDDSDSLSKKLSDLSFDGLLDVFEQIKKGNLQRTAQDETQTNYARKLTKEDGLILWNRTALEIHNQIRGLLPWPTAFTYFQKEPLQILKSSISGPDSNYLPGHISAITKEDLRIETADGALNLLRVKPAGKKEMTGGDFARGKRLQIGMAVG